MVRRTFEAGLPADVAALMLETVYATAPVGLCFVDSDLRFVVMNDHMAAINGRPTEDHIGRKVADVFGDLGRMLESVFRKVLDTGIPVVDMEILGDGRGPPWAGRRWLGSYLPVRCRTGRIVGVNVVVKEVTRQKLAGTALGAAEDAATDALERLNFALEKADAAEWTLDCRSGIAQWSPQMYSLYGLPPGTVPSPAIFTALLNDEDREEWRAAKDRAFATHSQEFRQDYRVNHPTKGLRWVSSRGYVRYSPAGVPERIGGIKIDITELMRVQADLAAAKDQADRANDAKSTFLAAASHDLRQPLQALNLYHGVLASRATPQDAPLLQSMSQCLTSLNELLGDLLDLSKLDAGVVRPNPAAFSVAELLDKIAAGRQPEADRKRLRLTVVPTRVVGRTDPVLFERVIGNLVSNAIRYTNSGGVVIGCRRRQGGTWLEVWDSGIGIASAKFGEIFEPFRQLDNPERGQEKGSGLGLAIVKKATMLLGLAIRVSSRPGKGSMFAVELPLGERPAEVSTRPADTIGAALRIALVEDDSGVRDAAACALEAMGHQVVAAASASDLVGRLDHHGPDVMIADYRLVGRETGLDAIAAVRASFAAPIPAAVLTGDTDPEIVRQIVRGGVRVLHKPLGIEALRTCVTELMDGRATTERSDEPA